MNLGFASICLFDLTAYVFEISMNFNSRMCYLGTDKTVKHKASLKVGKWITIQNVKHLEVLDNTDALANKYRKNTQTC